MSHFEYAFFSVGGLSDLTSSVFRNTVPYGRISSVETKAIHAARFVVNTPTRHYRTWQRRHGSFTLDPGAGDERATTAWASRNAFGNCANDTNTRNILAANVSSGILEPPSMKARKMAQKNLIQSHMISLLFHESVILHDLRRSSRWVGWDRVDKHSPPARPATGKRLRSPGVPSLYTYFGEVYFELFCCFNLTKYMDMHGHTVIHGVFLSIWL